MASPEQPEQQIQNGSPIREEAPTREALIATAVKFLQNQKVRQSPLATRKAFLKKKGLTDEEVELAIQRSGCTEEPLALAPTPAPLGPPHPLHPSQLAPLPHSAPGYRWRDYGALAVIMAGMAFGFHHLYRKYILPLLMGRREDKQHLQRMEASMAEMSGTLTQTVTQLQITLAAVQELLVQQQQKIQDLSNELANSQASSTSNRILESQTISDLKAEVISLKGLLLSRRQFPASPSVPKIPAWQIPLKPSSSMSNPPSTNHTNSSSDISPVSNESTASSPIKDSLGAPPSGTHALNGDPGGLGGLLPLDLKDQVRMEVQGEEEKKQEDEEEEEEDEEDDDEDDDDDGTQEEEEEHLSVQTEDRRGGDGQFHEQVDKLRRPEGASNESEG